MGSLKTRHVLALTLLTLTALTSAYGQNTVTIDGSVSDWGDEYCVADPDPADCDDFTGQQDAKGACIASNYVSPGPATTAYLRFDFDEVGANGANTLDGCWLVDVNQNGMVDRALCFSLSSTMGRASSITTGLFTCNDSAPATCGMDTPVVGSSATCAFNNATADADQLADCDVGDEDLAVECSADLVSDLGWSGGTVSLVQGCSSTSATPNSSTFDCFGSPGAPLIIDPENGDNVPVELQSFEVR